MHLLWLGSRLGVRFSTIFGDFSEFWEIAIFDNPSMVFACLHRQKGSLSAHAFLQVCAQVLPPQFRSESGTFLDSFLRPRGAFRKVPFVDAFAAILGDLGPARPGEARKLTKTRLGM